jgi:hypothetical protein
MLAELLLIAAVQEHADRVAPGDAAASSAAVRTALCAYMGGASSSEALRAAEVLLGSWSRHPSTSIAVRPRSLVAAS